MGSVPLWLKVGAPSYHPPSQLQTAAATTLPHK